MQISALFVAGSAVRLNAWREMGSGGAILTVAVRV